MRSAFDAYNTSDSDGGGSGSGSSSSSRSSSSSVEEPEPPSILRMRMQKAENLSTSFASATAAGPRDTWFSEVITNPGYAKRVTRKVIKMFASQQRGTASNVDSDCDSFGSCESPLSPYGSSSSPHSINPSTAPSTLGSPTKRGGGGFGFENEMPAVSDPWAVAAGEDSFGDLVADPFASTSGSASVSKNDSQNNNSNPVDHSFATTTSSTSKNSSLDGSGKLSRKKSKSGSGLTKKDKKKKKTGNIRPLASGGNGQILLATVGNKEDVIVKVTSYENAMRESSILRRLTNVPNVIHLLGFMCKPHQQSVMLLENASGGSLRARSSSARWGSRDEAAWVASRETLMRPYIKQMVASIYALHERGIVHLDVKCDNFVLTKTNTVKLIDFGTSRFTAHSPLRRHAACDTGFGKKRKEGGGSGGISGSGSPTDINDNSFISNRSPIIGKHGGGGGVRASGFPASFENRSPCSSKDSSRGPSSWPNTPQEEEDTKNRNKNKNNSNNQSAFPRVDSFNSSQGGEDQEEEDEQLEQTLGSVLWMAPEILKSMVKTYVPSADIWSLGCAIIEVLQGGEPPWCEGFASPHSAVWAIGISKARPSNVPRDVSPACADFLDSCFHQDPVHRATAEQLRNHPFLTGATASFATSGAAAMVMSPTGSNTSSASPVSPTGTSTSSSQQSTANAAKRPSGLGNLNINRYASDITSSDNTNSAGTSSHSPNSPVSPLLGMKGAVRNGSSYENVNTSSAAAVANNNANNNNAYIADDDFHNTNNNNPNDSHFGDQYNHLHELDPFACQTTTTNDNVQQPLAAATGTTKKNIPENFDYTASPDDLRSKIPGFDNMHENSDEGSSSSNIVGGIYRVRAPGDLTPENGSSPAVSEHDKQVMEGQLRRLSQPHHHGAVPGVVHQDPTANNNAVASFATSSPGSPKTPQSAEISPLLPPPHRAVTDIASEAASDIARSEDLSASAESTPTIVTPLPSSTSSTKQPDQQQHRRHSHDADHHHHHRHHGHHQHHHQQKQQEEEPHISPMVRIGEAPSPGTIKEHLHPHHHHHHQHLDANNSTDNGNDKSNSNTNSNGDNDKKLISTTSSTHHFDHSNWSSNDGVADSEAHHTETTTHVGDASEPQSPYSPLTAAAVSEHSANDNASSTVSNNNT